MPNGHHGSGVDPRAHSEVKSERDDAQLKVKELQRQCAELQKTLGDMAGDYDEIDRRREHVRLAKEKLEEACDRQEQLEDAIADAIYLLRMREDGSDVVEAVQVLEGVLEGSDEGS